MVIPAEPNKGKLEPEPTPISESAGSELAAALAQRLHDQRTNVDGQPVVYPMVDDRTAVRSDIGAKEHLARTNGSNRFGWESYLGAVPSRRRDFSGLPPTWIDAAPSTLLTKSIAEGLQETLSYSIPVLLRSSEEVQAITRTRPFTADQLASPTGKVQVSLLTKSPAPHVAQQVLDMATPEDLLHLQGRELYWLPTAGMSNTALNTLAIERQLGTQTRRTLNTLQRLTKKFLT